ncbi:MAG: glucose-6-phosphate dehydrogenase [Patescibacteria group bacterium]
MLKANPTTLVVFGATGDLFRTKLAPALLALSDKKELPEFLRIVAFSRRPWDNEKFREFIREALVSKAPDISTEILEAFLDRIFYCEGNFDTLESYQKVAEMFARFDAEAGVCTNKLLYLATSPAFYETILQKISSSGLAIPCAPVEGQSETGWTRVLIEKPFGHDLKNAERLDNLLAQLFTEEQIFRIDHYLAKETMRSILQFRFSNGPFESIWNSENIDTIDVKFLEKDGVGSRGESYDGVGALRDVGQNHLLQMATLVAMENPRKFSVEAIRKARAEVLEKFKLAETPPPLRAQYVGFREEKAVSPNSQTETYFRCTLNSSAPRWRDTAFVLEAGKATGEHRVEIVIHFKKSHDLVCPVDAVCSAGDNTVKFDILSSSNKRSDAYERVLLDAIMGDQTLFISTAEVIAEWKLVEEIFKKWEKTELVHYAKGSMPKI